MAPDPSGRLCLLLLLSSRLVPASADGNSLSPLNPLVWLWPAKTTDSLETPVSKPQISSPVQSTENPATHVVPQDGLPEQQTTPASPRLPPQEEDREAGQGGSPATPAVPPIPLVAPAASPDMKEENVAGVGAKILNVAQGIRSFVQLWDEDSTTEHSAGVETSDSLIPTVLPTPAELSSAPQGSKTTLWLSSGVPRSAEAQTTEAGTLVVPTQPPPPFQSILQAPRGRPSVPPASPGRAFLSSTRIRAPPWGSQESPRQPQHLEGKGLLPTSSQQHRHSDVHFDIHGHVPLLPLVTGPLVTGPLVTASLSVHGLLSVPSSDSSAQLSRVEALPGFPGAWVSHVAPSSGPELSNDSALVGNGSLTSTSRCLPLPPTLTICSRLGIGHFWLPNHLRHTDSAEVEATAQAWGRLLHSSCHPFLAWFFCLLLAPSCGPGPPPALPPCRQFCEALEDECWNYLAGDRLPVVCASLPSQEDGYCVFIGPAAGNQVATIRPLSFWLFVKRAQQGLIRTRHRISTPASLSLAMVLARYWGMVFYTGRRLGSGRGYDHTFYFCSRHDRSSPAPGAL